eukprot:4001863-Lingulodinium_polyedra.AAC.1
MRLPGVPWTPQVLRRKGGRAGQVDRPSRGNRRHLRVGICLHALRQAARANVEAAEGVLIRADQV